MSHVCISAMEWGGRSSCPSSCVLDQLSMLSSNENGDNTHPNAILFSLFSSAEATWVAMVVCSLKEDVRCTGQWVHTGSELRAWPSPFSPCKHLHWRSLSLFSLFFHFPPSQSQVNPLLFFLSSFLSLFFLQPTQPRAIQAECWGSWEKWRKSVECWIARQARNISSTTSLSSKLSIHPSSAITIIKVNRVVHARESRDPQGYWSVLRYTHDSRKDIPHLHSIPSCIHPSWRLQVSPCCCRLSVLFDGTRMGGE